jgi:hypothetical protein
MISKVTIQEVGMFEKTRTNIFRSKKRLTKNF